jgi:hypothetical protein
VKPIYLLVLVGLASATARADTILAAFDPSILTGYVGEPTVEVAGTLKNIGTGAIDGNSLAVYTIGLDVAASGLVADPTQFSPPEDTLAVGATTPEFEFFTLDFSNANVGTFLLDYQIFDETDTIVAQGTYQVNVEPQVAPEPRSMVLMGLGLCTAAFYRRRRWPALATASRSRLSR